MAFALLKIKKCTEKALFSPKALGSKKKINIIRTYESLNKRKRPSSFEESVNYIGKRN
jgi:hypothetical protein